MGAKHSGAAPALRWPKIYESRTRERRTRVGHSPNWAGLLASTPWRCSASRTFGTKTGKRRKKNRGWRGVAVLR